MNCHIPNFSSLEAEVNQVAMFHPILMRVSAFQERVRDIIVPLGIGAKWCEVYSADRVRKGCGEIF